MLLLRACWPSGCIGGGGPGLSLWALEADLLQGCRAAGLVPSVWDRCHLKSRVLIARLTGLRLGRC